jgi:hypothetical protein
LRFSHALYDRQVDCDDPLDRRLSDLYRDERSVFSPETELNSTTITGAQTTGRSPSSHGMTRCISFA